MIGIDYLYDEYKKEPERIEKLLSSEIEITEKLDASKFYLQVESGRNLIYSKGKDIQITKIDRTLSKFYESAIIHFDNLPDEKYDNIPDHWKFGMDYFPNLQPVTLSYDKLPLNHLVLTSIFVKDPKGKTIDVITEQEELNKWADFLEIEKPPIIFKGHLNEKQISRILDFLNTPISQLSKRFKTENFTRFIITLLNPALKNSFLNNGLDKDISGLIFRFDGKKTMRVVSPFNPLKTRSESKKPSDIYNLTLVLIQEFMIGLDFKKIKLKMGSFEDRYIEFVSKSFNKFLKSPEYKTNFSEDVDFELPQFLTRAESGVNFNFVENKETLENLEDSNVNRELFKIMLASLRSKKKKESGFFNKALIKHHNTLVDKIADYINSDLRESLFTFDEFRAVFLNESDDSREFGVIKNDEEEVQIGSINEKMVSFEEMSLNPNHVISTENPLIQTFRNFFKPKEVKKPKTQKPICIMKGKFFPFNNGHVAAVSDAAEKTNAKVFLVVLNKRSIDQELHRSMIEAVVKENDEISGFIFSDGRSWHQNVKDIPSRFSPDFFSGNLKECEDVKVQSEGTMTIQSTKHISSSNILNMVKNDQYDDFKKSVPKSLHNFFYKIKSII